MKANYNSLSDCIYLNTKIKMYYDRIEDLDDLECIENFESDKYSIAPKKEVNNLFNKLLFKYKII